MFKKLFDNLRNSKPKEPANEDSLHSEYQRANDFYLNGNQLGDKGNLEGAIEMYSKALEFVPTFWEALDNRGLARLDLKQYEAAKNDFVECLKAKEQLQLGLDDPTALVNLGVCYMHLKDWNSVKEVFTEALSKFPNDAKLQHYLPLASTYVKIGKK